MKTNIPIPNFTSPPILGEVEIKIILNLNTGASQMKANRPDVAWLNVVNCLAAQIATMTGAALAQVKDENQQALAVLKFLSEQIGGISHAILQQLATATAGKNNGLITGMNGGAADDGPKTEN